MIGYLVLLLYSVAVGGVVALLLRYRPAWSRRRVFWTVILPAPSAAMVAAAVGVAMLGPAKAGEIDATGMAMAVYLVGGKVLACALLALGGFAAWIAIRLTPTPVPRPEPAAPNPAFDALLVPLPDDVQVELRRRLTPPLPTSATQLLHEIHGLLVSAGIAEGRGGYPGGLTAPGWSAYVADQRRSIAMFRAVVAAWGDPPADLAEAIDDYDRHFPPPARLLGDGWEPHVEAVAGRHIYAFPVASGHATFGIDFPIRQPDVDVLLSDPYRRAVLEVVTHTVFQQSSVAGNPAATQTGFEATVGKVLHGPEDALAAYLLAFDREHHIRTDVFIRQAMARHATAAKKGDVAC
ncbi:hypothetical protein ASE67_03560 [Sphingomonas sp. Leaf23]|uniref:hypothetical protein n=1 Tax=Sphingomonas sp. Leaf23 TaxID=1735689 RepID=UPI0006FC0E55|nr:hypothetical protein [Sphingomonas sp. Leaf23]KQM88803.1 hypothetical protein ASE67_03560 [Sphingomonas sp. Leaf23]